MAVAKVIEIIGTSPKSWEDAANNAVMTAAKSVRNLKGMELVSQNAKIKDGKIVEFRAVVKLAFAYEGQ